MPVTAQQAAQLSALSKARTDLGVFLRLSWPFVNPGTAFVPGWHLDAIGEHLMAVTAGHIRRLIINVPPAYGKPLSVDTLVLMGDGRRVRLGDIVVGDKVITHTGKARHVLAVHEQGVLPVLRVRTFSGREVVGAADHRFLTPRGWVPLGDLRVGSCVERGSAALADVLVAFDAGAIAGDGIEALEPAGHAVCRCLSVDEDRSFVADGLIVHNTGLVSIAWPTWEWLSHPHYRYLSASHSQPLSEAINKKRRSLLQSVFYQQGMAPAWTLAEVGVRLISNSRQGSLEAVSVEGKVTGQHGDRQIMDDPLDARGAWTTDLAHHVRWWHDVFSSRARDGAAAVLVTQRLAAGDLSGDLLARMQEGGKTWTVLRLPERATDAVCRTVWQVPRGMPVPARPFLSLVPAETATEVVFSDPREVGAVLCPRRFSDEEVTALWAESSASVVAAQRQQEPRTAAGRLFPEEVWRFWHHDAGRAAVLGCTHLPPVFDAWACAFDTTFEGEVSSDYFVGIVGASLGSYLFVLDMVRERAGFVRACAIVRDLGGRWPLCGRWLLEKSANGPAIFAQLQDVVPGLRYVGVGGMSKVQRADAVSGLSDARQVFLPHPECSGFALDVFVSELGDFPAGKTDDIVDSFVHLAQWHLDTRRKGGDIGLPEVRPSGREDAPPTDTGVGSSPSVRLALGLPPSVGRAMRAASAGRRRALRALLRAGDAGTAPLPVSSRVPSPGKRPGLWDGGS